jgi:putative membrane protein
VAPSPATLLARWNLDPILLAGLAVALLAYVALAERKPDQTRIVAPWRRICFYVGWAVGAAALISPLCALSVSLFSARLGQHMVLETISAPLIALGTPARLFSGASPIPPSTGRQHRALFAASVFAVILWFWHAPGPYAATFNGAAVYWLMHVTAFAAALWLWRAAFESPGEDIGGFLAAMSITTLQMGFLGALLTFSARPFYTAHALTTWAWGLSPLDDQRLGGIIMWIPTGAIFVTAMVVAVGMAFRRSGAGPVILAMARP